MMVALTEPNLISISLPRSTLPHGFVRFRGWADARLNDPGWPRHVRLGLNKNNGVEKKKDRTVANEKSQNVQDVFLNHVRKQKTPVTVFLVNGVKLQGIITWFDNFSVLLRRDGHTQLVYKHAISTVMPGAPIQLFDSTKAEGAAVPTREMSPAAGD
jgi:host factor-I protein